MGIIEAPASSSEKSNVTIRSGTLDDLPGIESLFRTALQREPNSSLIVGALRDYPSTVATLDSGEIIGFAYCGYMAPDLLELMNITVHADYRSTGLGTRMLKHVERSVFEKYAAIMLTNSVAYMGDGEKRSASNFYLRNGYKSVASTEATNLYWKSADR